MSHGYRSGRSTGSVVQKHRVEALWCNSLFHISCVNISSATEFGNKVKSCGTDAAKIFYCYRLEPVR